MGENRLVEETLDDSLARLDEFIDALPSILGFTPGDLILGGFSQGGTTSMAWSLTRPGRVVTALNFSGFVHAGLALPSGADAESATPIFWGHGTQDPAIPYGMAISGRAALTAAGLRFTTSDHAIGHSIVREEVDDAVAYVQNDRASR